MDYQPLGWFEIHLIFEFSGGNVFSNTPRHCVVLASDVRGTAGYLKCLVLKMLSVLSIAQICLWADKDGGWGLIGTVFAVRCTQPHCKQRMWLLHSLAFLWHMQVLYMQN